MKPLLLCAGSASPAILAQNDSSILTASQLEIRQPDSGLDVMFSEWAKHGRSRPATRLTAHRLGDPLERRRINDNPNDPFMLQRFLDAQEDVFDQALSELRAGRKRSHWMWFIFPQIDGLGFSSTTRYFAIKGIEEARAYLDHPVLGSRLWACAEAVLSLEGRSTAAIFGHPDDLKLKSSATLFACALPPGSVFDNLLEKYYAGSRDDKTLRLLGMA